MTQNEPTVIDRLRALSEQYNDLRNSNRSKKQEVAEYQLECQEMKNELLKLKKDSDSTFNEIQIANQRYQAMEENFSSLSHSVENEIEQIIEFDDNFLKAKERTAELNYEIQEAKVSVQEMCDEREELNAEIKELENQKNLLAEQKKDLNEERTRLFAEQQKLQGNMAAVMSKIQ